MLPTVTESAGPYSSDLAARSRSGPAWKPVLEDGRFDAMLDNGATGLAFVPDPMNPTSVKLSHEMAEIPLVSQFIDPVVTVFQQVPWQVAWQTMQSTTWCKCIWDGPQVRELQEMGIPNVHYLPMAAIDRDYDTTPLIPDHARQAVSFVGNQNTSYFAAGVNTSTANQLYGVLAHSVRSGMPDMHFWDIYQELYGCGACFEKGESVDSTARKAETYFARKLFYNAFLCIQQRDRFVIFLKRRMGDSFTLVGQRWDTAYGLQCNPTLPTCDEYLNHFRETAVNINLVNGNTDSGLNMRHFEITAAGGFMLCYHQEEIDAFFKVGKECDTFRTEEELLDKIHHYLTHPDERRAIALAGQKRTLGEHLYSHRLMRIKQILSGSTSGTPAEVANSATETTHEAALKADPRVAERVCESSVEQPA